MFGWRDANTFLEAGQGSFESAYVSEPFFPSGPGDDGRELRKLVAGLLDEFDDLQGRVQDAHQRLDSGEFDMGDPQEDLEKAINGASDTYLECFERCIDGLARAYAAGSLSAAGGSLQGLLPKIKSIWSLCTIHCLAEESSIAPRVFLWLRTNCLEFYEHDTCYPLHRVSRSMDPLFVEECFLKK